MQEPNLEHDFRTAFDSYADELFRHAFYRLSDRDKALDVVQDTFLRAWDYARTGADIGNMRAFLYRTLRNLVIDEYRRKKSSSLDAMMEDEGGLQMAALTAEENALGEAMDRLDAQRVLELVPELPHAYAEVILLRFVDGLTIGEIAERVDASENLISVRIHRALKALKTLFDDRSPKP